MACKAWWVGTLRNVLSAKLDAGNILLIRRSQAIGHYRAKAELEATVIDGATGWILKGNLAEMVP